MRKFIISFFGLLFLISCSSSHNKNIESLKWLSETYRNVHLPSNEYYLEFSEKNLSEFSSKSEADIRSEFRKDLETQLVKGIVEKISFSMTSSELQTENKRTDYISSVLRQSSQSASATLIGKEEVFYLDRKKKTISGMVYVKKSVLAQGYQSSLSSKIDVLQNQINNQNLEIHSMNSPMSAINLELKKIQEEMEIYLIIDSSPDEVLHAEYLRLLDSTAKLNDKYGNLKFIIDSLINEADKMFQRQNDFEDIINKLNEALLYDSTNSIVLAKKNEYISKWIAKLNSELNSKSINKEYKQAIEILNKLSVIDPNNESVYKIKQNNLIESYFNETITMIRSLLKNGALSEATNRLAEITKYSYVDNEIFKKVQIEIDSITIDNAVRTIENFIYDSNLNGAAIKCKEMLRTFPNDKTLKQLFDQITDAISANKKKELLNARPTRYVVELNYSFANMPITIYDKAEAVNIKDFNIASINEKYNLSLYQLGLYRKINIRKKEFRLGKKQKFSYSQIGLRAGFLETSTYRFTDQASNTNYLFKPSQLIQLEASYIWRRFFMFNLGCVIETLPQTQYEAKRNNYYCSTIGFRIPFNLIHLTADLTGFSNGSNLVKAYVKAGISVNIGLSKKFNNADQKYIENEVIKLKN